MYATAKAEFKLNSSIEIGEDQVIGTPSFLPVVRGFNLRDNKRHCVNLSENEIARANQLMPRTGKAKVIRVASDSPHSLVRTRTTRKKKSRKRPTPKNLASKLAALRQGLGLSQGEIASKIGVDNRASISGYERGEREPPLTVLLAYARLAKVSVETLIDDELDLPAKF